MVEFAFMDEVTVSDDGNMATYRHSSWPANANIQVIRTSAATPGITGKVKFDYPQFELPVAIDFETLIYYGYYSEMSYKASNIKVDLHWDINTCYEKKARIWFKMGGEQEIPTVDTSAIGGSNVVAEYTKRGAGGLHFLGTAGSEWFVKREFEPQVQVWVNGIMSDCQGDCSYQYDASLSATVTAVDSSESAFSGGDVLTITGTNLENAKVENPPCTYLFHSKYLLFT